MTLCLGNIATGEDFFDREAELDDLWSALQKNHVALTGPRRLGKSSILKRMTEQATDHGLLAGYVDLQGIDRVARLIDRLDRAFPEASIQRHLADWRDQATTWVQRHIHKVGVAGVSLELNPNAATPWQSAANRVQHRLAPQPLLILIDEFTVFLDRLITHDLHEAALTLGWLRSWRQQSGLACRFVFTGSIGLAELLERHRLTTLMNDCYDYVLQPFTRRSALAMAATFSSREGWQATTATLDHLCDRTGWLSPYYLNLLLDEAMKAGLRRLDHKGVLNSDDIELGYGELAGKRSCFVHWYQRLLDLPQPRRDFVLAVLRYAANSDAGVTRPQLGARLGRLEADPDRRETRLEETLIYLEEQGYLGQNGGRYAFLSFLLRDYWKANHG